MKGKVALVIVFNHRYDKNIKTLEAVYQNRFSHIYFLVPFYDGMQSNVIPVYENSYMFEGYLSQGFKKYFNEQYEHYFFVADDMILNPLINEETYNHFFQLENEESYIPEIFSLHELKNNDTLLFRPILSKNNKLKNYWWRVKQAVNYSPYKAGVENESEIPSFEDAVLKITKHGYEIKPLSFEDVNGGYKPGATAYTKLLRRIKYYRLYKHYQKKYILRYPLVASYSDIVIVHKKAIRKFIHYCGVFAATDLYVELAIPTALLLAANIVKTEPVIGKRGVLYWNYSDEQKLKYNTDMKKYNFDLYQLLASFPPDKLYLHPIKLSQWKTEL